MIFDQPKKLFYCVTSRSSKSKAAAFAMVWADDIDNAYAHFTTIMCSYIDPLDIVEVPLAQPLLKKTLHVDTDTGLS